MLTQFVRNMLVSTLSNLRNPFFIMTSCQSNGTFSVLLAFARGIHRSPVNSPHKGQWRGDLMFSLICAWINGWVNNRLAGDLRRHRTHYDVTLINCNQPAQVPCVDTRKCHLIFATHCEFPCGLHAIGIITTTKNFKSFTCHLPFRFTND